MIKLAIGATVMLKSGSPPMTVFEFREELIEVCWCANGLINRDTFHFQEVVELIAKDVEFVMENKE